MTQLSLEKQKEIIELVEKQKKAKLNWVATITQTAEEDLKENAKRMGLAIEGEFILAREATKEEKAKEYYMHKRDQAIVEIIDKRTYRYNPDVTKGTPVISLQGSTTNITKTILMSFQSYDTFAIGVAESFTPLRRVIYPFEGDAIDIPESDARQYLEQMKQFLQRQLDEYLRLWMPVKRYYEQLVLPLIGTRVTKIEQEMILERAEMVEIELIEKAYVMIDSTITKIGVDKKGYLVELEVKLPNNIKVKINISKLKQFMSNLLEVHLFNLRSEFYSRKDLIREVIGRSLREIFG